MIHFVFKSQNPKKVDFREIDDHVASKIIPSPQITKQDDQKCAQFDYTWDLIVKGTFTPSEQVTMEQSLYHLKEPDWNVKEFVTRIPDWLQEEWAHKDTTKLSINILKITEETVDNLQTIGSKIPEDKHSQAYFISINEERIQISAWTKHGAYYAFLTLSQLIKIVDTKLYVPLCTIWDYPDYEYRGLEDDISRGQRPTMEHFKEFIHYLSRMKLNADGLYIEDMFKFDKYPSIGNGRNPLTKEEIAELEDYALENFVEIQPAVEMFGHMDNMLTIPKFRKYGEFPGAQCFDVSSEETRELVDDLLKELCEAFSSETFHLVCDESFDYGLWRSRDYINEHGKAEVLAEWYLFLVDIIKKYGKEIPGFAHDIIIHYPKTMELVKDDIPLIHFWSYSDKKKYPTISKLIKQDFEVAAVPTTFDWSRHYPYSDYAEKNTIYMGKDALERGAKFLITTKFGDFFNENLRENIRYGLAIEAQAAWNIESNLLWSENGDLDCSELKKVFIHYFFDSDEPRIIECMDILNKQNDVLPSFPNGMINRFWMDPYCREIKKDELHYQKRFIEESSYVLKTIKEIRKSNSIQKNKYHLEYIEFAARMALHFGVKILCAEAAWSGNLNLIDNVAGSLNELMQEKLIALSEIQEGKVEQRKDLTPYFRWLSKDIMDQKELYSKLWLALAVPEGLEYPDHRFEVLNWYYERSIEDLEQNIKPQHTQLKSEWIWKNGLRWKWNWGNREPNFFAKKFTVDKKIKSAKLQGIANNYMDIFVNGEHIGEVFSRFSLSQLPMAKSVQIFDITELLKHRSEQVISVEGWNYANGIGCINIIIHLEFEDGTSKDIITNNSWNYRDERPNNWPLKKPSEIENDKWKKARSFGRPPLAWNGPISRPNWEKGWKSEISFTFGLRNYVETSITSFVGENLFKILFWLVPLGTRIMGTDIHGFREL